MSSDAVERRERRIAVGFDLPWAWRVRVIGGRLVAMGNKALPCGHRSVGVTIHDDDLLLAASVLAARVRMHKGGI